MILGHIIAKNKKQAKEIVKLLLAENLLYNAGISTKRVYEKNKTTGTIEYRKQTLIIGKTKALLFTVINDVLREKYLDNMPMLYAVPIIYMDEEQSNLLRKHTAKA